MDPSWGPWVEQVEGNMRALQREVAVLEAQVKMLLDWKTWIEGWVSKALKR